MSRQGLLIVISGPSGAGKGTVCRALLAQYPELVLSVSKTTRPPRVGEQDGVNYYFVSREEFSASISAEDFLEYACVYGEFYGTPRRAVQNMLEAGQDVILEIDTQGALQVKGGCPAGVFVFLLPPSEAELQARLLGRGTESPEKLRHRLSAAAAEVAMAYMYDYVVINDVVEKARDQIAAIIRAEKCRTARNAALIEAITGRIGSRP